MLTAERHGIEMHFDDAGFTETPYVLKPLTRGALYEEKFLEHIRSLQLGGVYVDAGAHLGTHAIWFALQCPSSRVEAFEPVGRYADVIERNIVANELVGRVVVRRVGLSDRAGTASNVLSHDHQLGFAEHAEAVEEVFPTDRLDRVVRGRVGLIKIDVEGMEPVVLAGAARILDRDRPYVFAESRTPAEFEAVKRVLGDFGYVPTGLVFNATPTHEFVAPPRRGLERLRWAWRRVPPGLRRALWRLRHR